MDSIDEIIALYRKDVDKTLIIENLKRTPTERVQALMHLQYVAEEARRGMKKALEKETS